MTETKKSLINQIPEGTELEENSLGSVAGGGNSYKYLCVHCQTYNDISAKSCSKCGSTNWMFKG
ncbi:MAG: hypothetical protein HUJ63_09800 [Enterococcus sp.]|nr:hypothetical protein [Enterococcus sp.]